MTCLEIVLQDNGNHVTVVSFSSSFNKLGVTSITNNVRSKRAFKTRLNFFFFPFDGVLRVRGLVTTIYLEVLNLLHTVEKPLPPSLILHSLDS